MIVHSSRRSLPCFTERIKATVIGPSISDLLISGLGYIGTFYISGLFGLAGTIIAFTIAIHPHTTTTRVVGGFKMVLRNRNLVTASLALMVLIIPLGLINAFFPLYAENAGVGPEGIGLFFTAFAVSLGCMRPIFGTISDRIGRVKVAIPFALLSAISIGSFALVGDLSGFLITGMMLGIGIGAAFTALYALSIDTIKPQLRGQAIAISQISIDTGVTIGAMCMGPVVFLSGYPTAFIITAMITLLGVIAFLGIRRFWKKEEVIYT